MYLGASWHLALLMVSWTMATAVETQPAGVVVPDPTAAPAEPGRPACDHRAKAAGVRPAGGHASVVWRRPSCRLTVLARASGRVRSTS